MSKTADVSLDKAAFLGLWLEVVLYGCHVTAFLFSLYLLRYKKSETPAEKFNPVIIFLVLIALFLLSTTHVSINLARGIVAFVSYQGSPNGASTYLKELWAPSNVAKQAAYVTNILISDYFALYRLYIMISQMGTQRYSTPTTSRPKPSTIMIALPTCSLLASAVCGYKSVYTISQRLPGEDAFMPAVSTLRISLLVLSLVTNALVTVIILVFIAYHSRVQSLYCSNCVPILGHRCSQVQPYYRKAFLKSLLQFGMVIPLSLIAVLVLYSLKMNANYIVFDSMTQIGGLFATMIIVHEQLSNIYDRITTTANALALDRNPIRKPESIENLGARLDHKSRPHLDGRSSPVKPPTAIEIRVQTEHSSDIESGLEPVAKVEEAGDPKLDPDDSKQGSDLGLDIQELHYYGKAQSSESGDDSGSEDTLVEEGRKQKVEKRNSVLIYPA